MIKVDKIYPIDTKSPNKFISDLEVEFLKRFKKSSQPEKKILEEISKYHIKQYSDVQIIILSYLYVNFEKILIGLPRELEYIISRFKKNKWHEEIFRKEDENGKEKTTEFGEVILELFGYENRFRDNKNRAIWLVKELNIKSCPYCNAQNTLIVERGTGGMIKKFQLDHFFPKSKYPYLSISLYNLIPSCPSCNSTKSSKDFSLDTHYHPYEMDLEGRSKFYLNYKPLPSLLVINNLRNQILKIEFKAKFKDPLKIIENHEKEYHIEGVYNRHQDIAEELLMLKIIYKKKQARNSYLKIKGLFRDKNDYDRFLLRNYSLKEDILKRPLAKFTQDIAKQLKLIK